MAPLWATSRLQCPAQGFSGLSAKHMASCLSEVLSFCVCAAPMDPMTGLPQCVQAPCAPL